MEIFEKKKIKVLNENSHQNIFISMWFCLNQKFKEMSLT